MPKVFLWFATQDGLNRYDGYEYKIYRPSSKAHSLNFHRINSLYITDNNELLVTTPHGIQKFNRQQDNFLDIPVFNPNGETNR